VRVIVATTCTPDDRKTLAAIRALGRSGATVRLASDRFAGQAPRSRYLAGRIGLGDPLDDPDGFAERLASAARETGTDAVLPTTDAATAACCRHRDRLASATGVCLPDFATWDLVQDKGRLGELAARLGIRVPTTSCPADREELLDLAERIAYPCVLKLRRGSGAVGLAFPADRDALAAAWDALPPVANQVFDGTHPLVQEVVPGEVHDVATLSCRGELRAAVTSRRLLTLPARAGMGILTETTDEPELVDLAAHLLRALAWHGPALVEFVVDARDHRPTLLEVNGRLWGGVDLNIAAGVNFPLLACRLARDGDVEPVLGYRVGLRFRWPFPAGLVWALDSRRPLAAARYFFLPSRRTCSNLDPRDPLPHLAEAVWLAQRAVRAGLRWDPRRLGALRRRNGS